MGRRIKMSNPIEQLLDTIQYEDLEKGENVTDGELYAIKKGTLTIAGFPLTVYVLNDGRRIIDSEDFENFLNGKQHE